MLESIEAGLSAWLLPGATALLALLATYTAYRLVLALTRRFSRSKAVPRIFLDAATYVVLRVWDLRRLIVPLQWFIENPFQNWSRNTTDMLGTVFLWLDYAIPVQPLREEFGRLLRQSSQWDGKIETVQVTDSSEQALQIRFLMSAPDSSKVWDLRCAVREGLVVFVQKHYPEYLPRVRARLVDDSGAVSDK
ncbi:MAG: hypothetical protein L0J77_06480 [Marinobacter sp.]|uniref:hypothetical protein n=1 Tax=Marinobacter sp. TaxID=50741 RepID=UPI00265510C4|nr:hypothetical protein [Marinobacter sp.]